MHHSNCRAYQRHDRTATTKKMTLSAYHWSLIEEKQRELSRELNVSRVSKPLALRHILDESLKHGICQISETIKE
mgnify:CR=1 FL=1